MAYNSTKNEIKKVRMLCTLIINQLLSIDPTNYELIWIEKRPNIPQVEDFGESNLTRSFKQYISDLYEIFSYW